MIVKILFATWLLLSSHSAYSIELDAVTLQLKWQHQFQFAGYYAAKEKGFYKEAGLDVTIVEATAGMDATQEVLAGRAQFGVGTSELILNRYRGAPVLVLGVIFQHSPLALVTLKKSGIDNIHQLVDRKVMIEPNSSELFAYLQREGFTQKAFQLQNHSMDLNDLIAGRIDAMSIYVTDELFLLKQKKQPYNLFSPRMSGIDFYGDNFFTTESQLTNHPQRVQAFREATLRGWRYAMQHPDETVNLIYERYSQRHSIEHLQYEAAAMHELMQPELIEPGYMNAGRWQHIAQVYHEIGLLPEQFTVEQMLYFPDASEDLEKLKIQLYYVAAGLSVLALSFAILLRFYRRVRISEAWLNTLFDYAPLSLIVLDEQNCVQRWNTEAEKTFLWASKDIIGKSVLVIVPEQERFTVEKILSSVHKEDNILHHENTNIKRDGTEILCEWLNAPFRDQHNKSNFIICMVQDITEKKRLEQQLEQAAHYDNLTKLPNRALILEKLKQSLTTAARQKTKLAVLFLDLNGFKAVNDVLGHDAGDDLLVIVARRLPLAIRDSDHAGRLGGDEFLIILQDIDTLHHAKIIANKLQDLIAQPCAIKDELINIGVSIGISIYPDDATDITKLVNHADKRMYRNKAELRGDRA
jgi:diguanylate cyclase (GGDEF)-like protein/PAS domain S-box-containing protein